MAKAKDMHTQRAVLDARLRHFKPLKDSPRSPTSLLKSTRESLGVSLSQLGQRLNIEPSGVLRLEAREAKGTVTLALLSRAARALDCQLVYAIVPNQHHNSLESIVDTRAQRAAQKLVNATAHSMRLEGQGTDKSETKREIQRVARELKDKLDARLWDIDNDLD